MSRIWARLTRVGGSEDSPTVPSILNLHDIESYFGRFAQPAPKAENPFTHTTQHVIPCMYISSTHFAIIRDESISPNKYSIRDYSRNGTFLNSQLIGITEGKDLKENDLIALKYKEKEKIVYQFNLLSSHNVNPEEIFPPPVPASTNILPSQQGNRKTTATNADLATGAYPLKKADSTSEVFTQQISNLQIEIKRLENKLTLTNEQLELITKENEKITRKSRQDEKQLQQYKQEIDEHKDRIQAVESNANALEARNQILQDNIDDLLLEYKEAKNKNQFYSNELQEKTQALESLRQLVDEQNKAITTEKRFKGLLDNHLQEMKNKLQIFEEKNLRLINANQALQEIVTDLEQSNQQLQASLNEKVQYIDQINQIAKSQREKIALIETSFLQIFPLLQSAQRNITEIEKIPEPKFSLHFPLSNLDIQTQNDESLTQRPVSSGIHNLQQLEQGDLFQLHLLQPSNVNPLEESLLLHLPIPTPTSDDKMEMEGTVGKVVSPAVSTPSRQRPALEKKTDLPSERQAAYEATQAPDEEEHINDQKRIGIDFYAAMEEDERNVEETAVPSSLPLAASPSNDQKVRSMLDQLKSPFEDELVENTKQIYMKELDPSLVSQESVIRKSADTTSNTKISDLSSSRSSKEITPDTTSTKLSQNNNKRTQRTSVKPTLPLSQALTPVKLNVPPSQQSVNSESKRRSNNKRSRALSQEANEGDDEDASSKVSEQFKSPPTSQSAKKQRTASSPLKNEVAKPSPSKRNNAPTTFPPQSSSRKTRNKEISNEEHYQKGAELFPLEEEDEQQQTGNGSEGEKALHRLRTSNSMGSSSRSIPNPEMYFTEDDEDRQRTAFDL